MNFMKYIVVAVIVMLLMGCPNKDKYIFENGTNFQVEVIGKEKMKQIASHDSLEIYIDSDWLVWEKKDSQVIPTLTLISRESKLSYILRDDSLVLAGGKMLAFRLDPDFCLSIFVLNIDSKVIPMSFEPIRKLCSN